MMASGRQSEEGTDVAQVVAVGRLGAGGIVSALGNRGFAQKDPKADEQAYFGHYVSVALCQGSYCVLESQPRCKP